MQIFIFHTGPAEHCRNNSPIKSPKLHRHNGRVNQKSHLNYFNRRTFGPFFNFTISSIVICIFMKTSNSSCNETRTSVHTKLFYSSFSKLSFPIPHENNTHVFHTSFVYRAQQQWLKNSRWTQQHITHTRWAGSPPRKLVCIIVKFSQLGAHVCSSMADMDMEGRKVFMRRVHVPQDLKWINHGTEKKGNQWALSWVFCELFARECGCKKYVKNSIFVINLWVTDPPTFSMFVLVFDTTVAGENLQRFYTHINHMKFVWCTIFGGRIKLWESKFVENIIFRHAVSDEREKERTDVSKSCMNMRKQKTASETERKLLCALWTIIIDSDEQQKLFVQKLNLINCLQWAKFSN